MENNKNIDRFSVQKKAEELGHCVCHTSFTCPCKYFEKKEVCHCAGEELSCTHEEWVAYNL